MRVFYRVALRVCPILALVFSIIVTVTTMYINEGISPPLIFLSVQVYLNWYCIYSISGSATTMRSTDGSSDRRGKSVAIPIAGERDSRAGSNSRSDAAQGHRYKYWYCDKCCFYTYRPTQHCGPCNKCFHHRDHHCFFVGACVIRQNIGNFILICLHTSLACLYSLTTIGPHLYGNLADGTEGPVAMTLKFCFPVALARYLVAGEEAHLLLVTLFDSLFSVCWMCFMYGAWKLYLCLSGKQRYYPHVARKQDLKEIFGSYGLSNFVFPYNGFVGTRDIDGGYELKEV